MILSKRHNKFNPDETFGRLLKHELNDDDSIYFGALAQEFKKSRFYPLFLAVTARERHLMTLDKNSLHTDRADFVLGMIHENAVIENAIDELIRNKNRVLEEAVRKKAQNEPDSAPDTELGKSEFQARFGPLPPTPQV